MRCQRPSLLLGFVKQREPERARSASVEDIDAQANAAQFEQCATQPAGDNLTTAAMKAGFASPSHLADRFKTTFGLSATQLLGTGLNLRTP